MRQRWIVAAAIAALTIAVFGRVAACDFVNYDDPDYITSNTQVQKGLSTDSIKWAFFNVHGLRTYWHPVTWLSHMLDVQLFGLNPAAHHLVSLFFHTLNAVLLFLLLERLTGQLWPSAIAALVFALHPLQVDSVAWVTERKNLLCTLFWILTTLAYFRYCQRPRLGAYLLSILLFAIGLMCKPAIVVLPCALLLLDFWPLRRFPFPPADARLEKSVQSQISRLILEKIPFFVLALGSMLLTLQAHADLNIMGDAEIRNPLQPRLTFDLRLENAFVSYGRYLKKFFWPLDLAVLYPHPYHWPAPILIGSIVVVVSITGYVLWRIRRDPYLFVGWCWFIGVLVPAIGLVQVGTQSMADRFAYIPIIGLAVAITWKGLALKSALPSLSKVVPIVTALFITALAVLSWRQIGFWKDSEALWTHALDVEPVSPIAHVDLAAVLVDKGRPAEALERYREAVRYDPYWADAWALMASTYAAQKQYPEAVAAYRRAIELKPKWTDLMNNLAWILATCPNDNVRNGTEAVQMAQRASAIATNDLPMITGTLAAAYAESGNFDSAVQTAQKAHDLALAAGDKKVADRNEELMALYRAHKPYRDQ